MQFLKKLLNHFSHKPVAINDSGLYALILSAHIDNLLAGRSTPEEQAAFDAGKAELRKKK